jgi:hypothetical protein
MEKATAVEEDGNKDGLRSKNWSGRQRVQAIIGKDDGAQLE